MTFNELYKLLEMGYADKINTFGTLCYFYFITGALDLNEYTRKNNYAGLRDEYDDLKEYASFQDFMLDYITNINKIGHMQEYGRKNFIIYLYLLYQQNHELQSYKYLMVFIIKKLFSHIYRNSKLEDSWTEAKNIYPYFDDEFKQFINELFESDKAEKIEEEEIILEKPTKKKKLKIQATEENQVEQEEIDTGEEVHEIIE